MRRWGPSSAAFAFVVGSYFLAELISKRRRRPGRVVAAGPGHVSRPAAVPKPVALVAEEVAATGAPESVRQAARWAATTDR